MATIARCLHAVGSALTPGKLYPVRGYRDDWLLIRDDSGVDVLYPSVRFRIEHLDVATPPVVAPTPSPEQAATQPSASPALGLSILRPGVSLSGIN